jgi:hypothetical protein
VANWPAQLQKWPATIDFEVGNTPTRALQYNFCNAQISPA